MSGKEVRAIRKRLGFSQKAFAKMLGYERDRTISEIENDRAPISKAAVIILGFIVATENREKSE